MNCSCVFIDADDSPQFYKQTDPIAKKHHKCCECHRIINPKEQYRNISGLWDGRFDTYKTCSDCMDIIGAFFCQGWTFEHVMEDLKNHVSEVDGEISEDCLSDMTPNARAIVCEIIENVWESL